MVFTTVSMISGDTICTITLSIFGKLLHHFFGVLAKQMHLEEHNMAKHYSVIMATQAIVISVFLKSKFDL